MNNQEIDIKNDRIKWSKEKIISDIQELNRQNIPLNAINIMKTNVKLYGASRSYFGSWKDAVEAAGFDYDTINHKNTEKSWSKQIVIDEIVQFAIEDGNLRSDYVQKKYTKLHSAAQRYFKSWKDAVEAAGFDYDNIKKIKWTKEIIIMSILDLKNQNNSLTSSDIQKNNMPLFQASCRIFGSWKNAVEAAGINYKEIKKQREWEENLIKEELTRIKNEENNLAVTTVIKRNPSLYQATKRNFPNKNWKEILNVLFKEEKEV